MDRVRAARGSCPGLSTYCCGRRPAGTSHWARAACRLPVTGSSRTMPVSPMKARTSTAYRVAGGVGGGDAHRREAHQRAGCKSEEGGGLAQQEPHPSRVRCRSTVLSRRPGRGRARRAAARARRRRPDRCGSGAGRRTPAVRVPDAAGPARCRIAGRTPSAERGVPPGLQPGVRRSEGGMARERQLTVGGGDAHPVVGPGFRRAGVGTWSR